MENNNDLGYCEFDVEINKDIIYEVSKDVLIKTNIIYRQRDIINILIKKIKELEMKVVNSKNDNQSIVQESLIELWDNEYDERWNIV